MGSHEPFFVLEWHAFEAQETVEDNELVLLLHPYPFLLIPDQVKNSAHF